MNNTRHESSNQFKDGLWMDLHPLQVPNTVLTDNLNGTLITYNGNEHSLQNDMGNFKLKNCKLKSGYLPIGTASYADTIYILSYNPIEDNIELGSYPSPVQYNNTDASGYRQLLGVLENYLRGVIATNGVEHIEEPIVVNQTTLRKCINKITFDDNFFKLKTGDEYILNVNNSEILCGFEDLTYEVVFENGASQKFDPTQNEYGFTPVPWDTPGYIQISNRIFEVERNSFRIISKQVFTNRFEVKVAYEMFITDNAFIKKLDKEKDSIFLSNSPDHIEFNSFMTDSEGKNITGQVVKSNIESWLGEYRKIICIIKFEIPRQANQNTVYNVKIQPKFHTTFKISAATMLESESESENIPSKIFKTEIVLNENEILEEISLSEFSNEVIGASKFYWNTNSELVVSGMNIDDSIAYYKMDKIEQDNITYGEWTQFTIDDSGEGKIKKPDCDNNLYVWTFGRRNTILDVDNKHISSIINIETETTSDENEGNPDWWFITKDGEKLFLKKDFNSKYSKWSVLTINEESGVYLYNSDKYIVVNRETGIFMRNENVTPESSYVMINYDPTKMEKFLLNLPISQDKRYDKIPFNNIFLDWINSNFDIGSPRIDITSSDDSLFSLYGNNMDASGKCYKYFQRFVKAESSDNTEIFYPSIVPVNFFNGEDKSTLCFEIPRKINVNIKLNKYPKTSDQTFLGLPLTKLNPEITYCARKDSAKARILKQPLSENVTFKNVELWNKVDGQISQFGDSFYFADNIRYYQINFHDLADWSSFYTINKDQDGDHNVYTNDFSIDGYEFLWKSVDINNYRAIRLGYPYKNPTDIVGKSAGNTNDYGCRQVDFSVSSDKDEIANVMCQYISEFHKSVREKFDSSWVEPTLENSTNKTMLGKCSIPESSFQGCVAKLSATTFYRDKAQRASFTNKNDVTIIPNWERWNADEHGEGSGSDGRHYTDKKYFLAFPMYCSNNDDEKNIMKKRKWDNKDIYEKMTHTKDHEDWTHQSRVNQWSKVVIDKYDIEFAGIGLVNQSDSSIAPVWYVAWIPKWEDLPGSEQKYKLCNQTTVNFSPTWMSENIDCPDWCGYCSVVIDNSVFDSLKNEISINYPLVEINNIGSGESVLYKQDVWDKDIWSVDKLSKYSDKIKTYCKNDYSDLTQHPIFKTFIKTKGSAPNRIINYPIAGVYPSVSDSTTDAFSGISEFGLWKKFYVDGKGRPFLINMESEKNIFVCKNAKKKVFGYFPYGGEE